MNGGREGGREGEKKEGKREGEDERGEKCLYICSRWFRLEAAPSIYLNKTRVILRWRYYRSNDNNVVKLAQLWVIFKELSLNLQIFLLKNVQIATCKDKSHTYCTLGNVHSSDVLQVNA